MRLWSKREDDSEDLVIPAPVGIDKIMEYGMDGADPEGLVDRLENVTELHGPSLSSRRVNILKVRQPGEPWADL